MKRELNPLVDFWHCLTHQFNLSLNDALMAIQALKLFYIPHLRMCHMEFKRSDKNRAWLKEILRELLEFDKSFDWKIFYPALFCLTRWLGLQRCAEILSRKSVVALLLKYAQKLRDRGMGPRPFDPYKYQRRRNRRAAVEDRDGDDGSDDERETNELTLVQEAIEDGRLDEDGYQAAPELFDSAEEAARSAPSQEDMADADGFDEGAAGATGRKRKNLLNRDVGLTDLNIGRSAYLSGALLPYKILIKEIQRCSQPEQHLMVRRIRKFFMVMKTSWIGTAAAEPVFACQTFRVWVSAMIEDGKEDLVKLVKKECRAFCSVMVSSAKKRLESTWNYIQALELIDPLGPELARFTTPAVWDAAEDLCKRRGIDFAP